jgi:hypothetical protein
MLLSSNNPDDQQMALPILDRWLVSPDHETRTVAAQMLHTWLDEEGTDDPVVHITDCGPSRALQYPVIPRWRSVGGCMALIRWHAIIRPTRTSSQCWIGSVLRS